MIADELTVEIAKASVDSPAASESDIQQRWGVTRATARHAIADLRDRGLIYTVAGRGSFVSPQPNA